MTIKTGHAKRIWLGAVVAEACTYVAWILVLFAVGMILGDSVHTFAYLLGPWFGAIIGFFFCVLVSRRVGRNTAEPTMSGLYVGVACATISAIIAAVVVSKVPPVLFFGGLLRIAGGATGGWLAREKK